MIDWSLVSTPPTPGKVVLAVNNAEWTTVPEPGFLHRGKWLSYVDHRQIFPTHWAEYNLPDYVGPVMSQMERLQFGLIVSLFLEACESDDAADPGEAASA